MGSFESTATRTEQEDQPAPRRQVDSVQTAQEQLLVELGDVPCAQLAWRFALCQLAAGGYLCALCDQRAAQLGRLQIEPQLAFQPTVATPQSLWLYSADRASFFFARHDDGDEPTQLCAGTALVSTRSGRVVDLRRLLVSEGDQYRFAVTAVHWSPDGRQLFAWIDFQPSMKLASECLPSDNHPVDAEFWTRALVVDVPPLRDDDERAFVAACRPTDVFTGRCEFRCAGASASKWWAASCGRGVRIWRRSDLTVAADVDFPAPDHVCFAADESQLFVVSEVRLGGKATVYDTEHFAPLLQLAACPWALGPAGLVATFGVDALQQLVVGDADPIAQQIGVRRAELYQAVVTASGVVAVPREHKISLWLFKATPTRGVGPKENRAKIKLEL